MSNSGTIAKTNGSEYNVKGDESVISGTIADFVPDDKDRCRKFVYEGSYQMCSELAANASGTQQR